MNPGADSSASDQAEVTRRYNGMARIYDLYDAPMEVMGTKKRRRALVGNASGMVLEVGVGTGKNLRYYTAGVEVTGIDVSSQMLERAKGRMAALPVKAELVEGDVQDLQELGRVVRPDGQVLLLEHVRPTNRFLGRIADVVSVLTRRIFGFRTNRRTEENVAAAGLEIVEVTRNGVWREIVARPQRSG